VSVDAERPGSNEDTGAVPVDSDLCVSRGERADDESGLVAPALPKRLRSQVAAFAGSTHPAAWLVLTGVVIFTLVFARLGVQRHRNFGTWAFDLGIYDQGFWLVSRGKSFVTVRGLDFWGHHVNPIAILFAPFYWLGAGPAFLITVQAGALGAGAIPTYLLARDRMNNEWIGLVFAIVYLLYAPIQWIAWANFHPEALVVTPLLYAWWFASRRRWRPFFISVLLALSTREDVALAVLVMGLVLLWMIRRSHRSDRRSQQMAFGAAVLGVVWYAVSTRLVIPAFNQGRQPFYIGYFFGEYG
jgi:uncharacterized membrane protein